MKDLMKELRKMRGQYPHLGEPFSTLEEGLELASGFDLRKYERIQGELKDLWTRERDLFNSGGPEEELRRISEKRQDLNRELQKLEEIREEALKRIEEALKGMEGVPELEEWRRKLVAGVYAKLGVVVPQH